MLHQDTGAPAPAGIFDSRPAVKPTIRERAQAPQEDSVVAAPKETFKPVERQHADKMAELAKRGAAAPLKSKDELLAESAAAALSGSGPGKSIEAELDEMDRFNEEDIKLAEQLIFKGFAEFDIEMPKLPNTKLTICSTSAEEVAIADEIIYDMVKKGEDEKGKVNLPANNVQAMRNALFVSFCYRGVNKKELTADTRCHLNSIKTAVIRVSDLENAGDLDGATSLKKSLKKAIIERATAVKRLPTPLIDFITEKKYEFDTKMTAIMNAKNTIPKS
jgi:hypothetical protein